MRIVTCSWSSLALLALVVGGCSSDDEDGGLAIAGGSSTVAGGSAVGGSGGITPPGTTGGSLGGIDVQPGTEMPGGVTPPPPTDVSVIITGDNAYGFGYGDANQVLTYNGGKENPLRDDIFACPVGNGPESYVVPASEANVGNFLYIVGYADRSTTQGVLAEFVREGGQPVFTGSGNWQACATGQDLDPGSGGPSRDVINQMIAACNARSLDPQTSSVGWVTTTPSANGSVAVGEDNQSERPANGPAVGNEFFVACGINPQARWMWYEWEPARTTGSPFIWPGAQGGGRGNDPPPATGTNPIKDFIIFRLGAEFIPSGPPR